MNKEKLKESIKTALKTLRTIRAIKDPKMKHIMEKEIHKIMTLSPHNITNYLEKLKHTYHLHQEDYAHLIQILLSDYKVHIKHPDFLYIIKQYVDENHIRGISYPKY